jgi:hypothetical protein
MRRTLACYKRVGLQLDVFTTDFYGQDQPYYFDAFVVPKIDALMIWHKLVREWAGFAAYWVARYVYDPVSLAEVKRNVPVRNKRAGSAAYFSF